MKKFRTRLLSLLIVSMFSFAAKADVVFTISSSDYFRLPVFNNINSFLFEITIAGTIVPGGTYTNPPLVGVNYSVNGSLAPGSTPSGFTGFALVRTIGGAEFYNLSPESGLSFAVSPTADLSDGLQVSELVGTTDVLVLNAREFNQSPGRYHPPILRLNADGSGSLANADNESTFPNPPPPTGSGLIVNVEVGDEYIVNLSGTPPIDLTGPISAPSAARVPIVAFPLVIAVIVIGIRRIRTTQRASN